MKIEIHFNLVVRFAKRVAGKAHRVVPAEIAGSRRHRLNAGEPAGESRPPCRNRLASRRNAIARLISLTLAVLSSAAVPAHAATSGDNLPPAVVINRPALPDQPIHGIWVFLGAQASDADGRVVGVEYFINGESIGTVKGELRRLYGPDGSPSPVNPLILGDFGFYWSLPSGEYTLQAKATDDRGASTFSEVIHIEVIGPPTISIAATDAHASEPGGSPANAGAFTITRTGGVNGPLRVHYVASGSARDGVDYAPVANHVDFMAGEDSIRIVIDPVDDFLPEGREVVRVQLYHPVSILVPAVYPPPPPAYYLGTNSQALVFIADDDGGPTNQLPIVAIDSPADGQTVVGPNVLLRAIADDPDGRVERVEFFANGERIGVVTNLHAGTPFWSPWVLDPGTDFQFLPVPIPSLTRFNLSWKARPGEYVIMARSVDNNGAEAVSDPIDLTVIKPAVVRVRATDPLAAESGPDQGTFTITRSGGTGEELQVYYVLGGTAANEIDYALTPNGTWDAFMAFSDSNFSWPNVRAATIPAGQERVQITVTPVDDEVAERLETVSISLVVPPAIHPPAVEPHALPYFLPYPQPSYQLGDRSRATVMIKDNDRGPRNHPPKASILAPRSGRAFPAGSDIDFEVKTTDRESYVYRVEFFAGLRKIGEVTQNTLVPPPPGSPVLFDFTWANAPAGFHTLWVRATDTLGGIGVSKPVFIRVR